MTKQKLLARMRSEEMKKKRKAVGDVTRIKILNLLERRPEWTAKQFADELSLNKNRLYYHLRILEDAGMISVIRTQVAGRMSERVYGARGLDQRVMWDSTEPEVMSAYMTAVLEWGKIAAEEGLYEIAREVETDGVEGIRTKVEWGAPRVVGTNEDFREFIDRVYDLEREFAGRAKDRDLSGEDKNNIQNARFHWVFQTETPLRTVALGMDVKQTAANNK